MSYSVNRVELIGRVGRDPETKQVGGKTVVSFSIATSYKPKGGEERTEWHQISAWEKLGEIAMQVLHKGDNVRIEGRISYNVVGEGDAKKTYTQITATSLINLSEKKVAGTGTATTGAQTGTTASAAAADEDIPF